MGGMAHKSQPGQRPCGKLFVLSGPSGSGKSTVVSQVLALARLPLRRSVSATTRQPRPGEIDGQDYHFWTPGQFDEALKAGAFLEWAEVYGQRYGTLKSEVDPYLAKGVSVLLEIDVQGAKQIRRLRPDAVLVFLRTSSLAEYERRLRARGTEEEAALRRRLAAAQQELAEAPSYDYQVINDDLAAAVQEFRGFLQRYGGP
jgi:guanylate kinase